MISPVRPDTTVGAGAFVAALHRSVTYAFQPIVNVHTGEAYGFEALLRGHRDLGFSDIPALFASITDMDLASDVKMLLLERAAGDFMSFAALGSSRLFFNANNRVLNSTLDHRPLLQKNA